MGEVIGGGMRVVVDWCDGWGAREEEVMGGLKGALEMSSGLVG